MAGLGYAGLLPFYGTAFYYVARAPEYQYAALAFIIYAIVILAFLGGTLWGYAVTLAPAAKYRRLLLSNTVALFAATAGVIAIFGGLFAAVTALALGQLGLLAYERAAAGSLGWYLRLRTRLTLGALPAHLLVLFAMVRPING